MYKCEMIRKSLQFKIPAKTSRGAYTTHEMLILRLEDEQGKVGYGECAPLPDLSSDRDAYRDLAEIDALIADYLQSIEKRGNLEGIDVLSLSQRQIENRQFPIINSQLKIANCSALLFALESALLDIARPTEIFSTPFARGEAGIPINGLIWMADYENMLRQIERKLNDGFRCIKLKIGAINWADELALLKMIRRRFSLNDLTLRVDANGAFSINNAMQKLDELAAFDIHSIEQPIGQGNWQEMAFLCENSPVPIALDEELIGVYDSGERIKLLETIKPQYVVVKPTLHGGLSGATEWVTLARRHNIGSWLTSALESNIGFRSIALLAAYLYGPDFNTKTSVLSPQSSVLYQGLGTGQLFVENIPSTLHLMNDRLYL